MSLDFTYDNANFELSVHEVAEILLAHPSTLQHEWQHFVRYQFVHDVTTGNVPDSVLDFAWQVKKEMRRLSPMSGVFSLANEVIFLGIPTALVELGALGLAWMVGIVAGWPSGWGWSWTGVTFATEMMLVVQQWPWMRYWLIIGNGVLVILAAVILVLAWTGS